MDKSTTMKIQNTKIIIAVAFTLLMGMFANAQTVNTAYFMEQSVLSTSLNPSFQPKRGYLSIPVLGGFGMSMGSNSLSLDKLVYPTTNGELVTFMDSSIDANTFLGKLKQDNSINSSVAINIFGYGQYLKRGGFLTVDLSAKANGSFNAPKGLFELMKQGSGVNGQVIDISNIALQSNGYLELAGGYSHPINSRLTVGGKVKFLVGMGSAKVEFDHLQAQMSEQQWLITSSGTAHVAMNGIQTKEAIDNDNMPYIDGFNMDSFNGIGGYGGAIDLGATYELIPERLKLSVAVLDLGFISWSKEASILGENSGSFAFDGFEIPLSSDKTTPSLDDQISSMTGDLKELIHFTEAGKASFNTMLPTTVNVGAEYGIADNIVSFGALSTTKFYSAYTTTELMLAVNVRPLSWLTATVSYSTIHGNNTLGAALNISPGWINIFIGTDYIPLSVSKQYVPINQQYMNGYFGISFPIGRSKRDVCRY